MNEDQKSPRIMREIPPEWDKLMRATAAVDYGELRILIQKGRPVMIEGGIKQIKLDCTEEEFKNRLKTIPLL